MGKRGSFYHPPGLTVAKIISLTGAESRDAARFRTSLRMLRRSISPDRMISRSSKATNTPAPLATQVIRTAQFDKHHQRDEPCDYER